MLFYIVHYLEKNRMREKEKEEEYVQIGTEDPESPSLLLDT